MDMRKEGQQNTSYRPKRPEPRRRGNLWLWLICGILLCQLTGITAWSRYSNKTNGIGTSVIASLVTEAEFSIDVGTLPSKPGESTAMNFMVTNYEGDRVTETLLRYTARLQTAGNLPLRFSLSPNDQEGTTVNEDWIAAGDMENDLDSGPGFLRQGEKTIHHYTLTVSWPLEENGDDDRYADEIDYVRVNIHAIQAAPE